MSETIPVREGEEIDRESLRAYLAERLDLAGREIEVEQFPAGSSNLTYLIRLGRASDFGASAGSVPPVAAEGAFPTEAADGSGTHLDASEHTQAGSPRSDVPGRADFVLRRPPHGNTVRSAHDMRREFDVLSKLSRVYRPAPKPLLFCDDESVIGSEFYLMERRHGIIIRGKIPGTQTTAAIRDRSAPPDVADGNFRPDSGTQRDTQAGSLRPKEICRAFIENLANLHRLDPQEAGLESLGRADDYNRRQVEGWTKRYAAAKTHEHSDLEKAITWLNANIPPESSASLIHNDYKFDNVMLDPEDLAKITSVLDWEMVTIGDPLMDLGTSLGYWMSWDAPAELLNMPFNPRILMENITRQELVEMYEKSLGRAVPDMLFYYVFGTFKIAVIAQQIYARYAKGFTKDERFARFDKFVGALGRIAAGAVASRSI